MKANTSVSRVRFAEFEVDFAQREIRRHGLRLRLQHKPFQILELLLRNAGALVTREEIARQLWPDTHVSVDRSLNTAMNILREALGDSSHGPRFIETRAGLGYSFLLPVEEADARASEGNGKPVHQDYLKGRYLLDKMTEEDTGKAVAYFESALLDDDRSALACAGLADAWCEFARLSIAPALRAGRNARHHAVLALSHDSQLAESHVALARVRMLFDWDWKAARAEFGRALEIAEGCAAAQRGYASLLQMLNDPQGALEHIGKAQQIEPLSLPSGVEYAWILYLSQDCEAAARQCWKMLALEPRFWPAQLILGLAHQQLGMAEESIAELENAVTCSGRNPVPLAVLGHLNPDGAGEVLRELEEQAARRHVPPSAYALVHAGRGATSDALGWLRRAFEERDSNLLWLRRSPLLRSLMPADGAVFRTTW
jgi:DNA-binding winged helix-turn-helix (wHTH) protein